MEEAGGLLLGTDTIVAMRQRKVASFIIGCSGNDIEDLFIGAGSDWAIGKPTPPNKVILNQLRRFLTKRKETDNLIGEQIILLAEKVAGSFEHAHQAGTFRKRDEAMIQVDCPHGKIHPIDGQVAITTAK
jgi:hypothetical protein